MKCLQSGELKHFLSTLPKPELLDILCVQKTRLNERIKFTFPGYAGEHRYRPVGTGGGVSTFVKLGIPYSVLVSLENNDTLECVSIQLSVTSGKRLTIHNVYHPPALPTFEASYRQLFSHQHSLLVGDLNTHDPTFGSVTRSARGRMLVELTDLFDIACLSTGAGTHPHYEFG